MRKLIFFLPFLFVPALASAAHEMRPAGAAFELRYEAVQLNRRVAGLRGNKQLKREARQFVKASNKLLKQTRRAKRNRKVRRTLSRLNYQFDDLRYAAISARVSPRVRRQLRRDIRDLSRALSNVEYALANGGRYAHSWSRSGYATDIFPDSRYSVNRFRRYRN